MVYYFFIWLHGAYIKIFDCFVSKMVGQIVWQSISILLKSTKLRVNTDVYVSKITKNPQMGGKELDINNHRFIVYLPKYLSVICILYGFIHQINQNVISVHKYINQSVYLSICLSVYLSFCLSVFLSIIFLSLFLSVPLSLCLSIPLFRVCVCV